MYKEITMEDMLDGKIYLHCITVLTMVLHYIILDDEMFNVFKSNDFIDSRKYLRFLVSSVTQRVNIQRYLFESEQQEYIEKFVRTTVLTMFLNKEIVNKLNDNKDKYREYPLEITEDLHMDMFCYLKDFDKLWYDLHGKIYEQTQVENSTKVE